MHYVLKQNNWELSFLTWHKTWFSWDTFALNLRFNFINRDQCRTLLPVLWQQQHFKMSTKYECDKGSRKNGRNPFATSHDCHFMHISSFTQTLRNRVGTLGIPNASFWRGLLEGKLFFSIFSKVLQDFFCLFISSRNFWHQICVQRSPYENWYIVLGR